MGHSLFIKTWWQFCAFLDEYHDIVKGDVKTKEGKDKIIGKKCPIVRKINVLILAAKSLNLNSRENLLGEFYFHWRPFSELI